MFGLAVGKIGLRDSSIIGSAGLFSDTPCFLSHAQKSRGCKITTFNWIHCYCITEGSGLGAWVLKLDCPPGLVYLLAVLTGKSLNFSVL